MTEVRAYDLDLEVRRTATERIIAGIVVPYNVEQQITRSLTEVFLPGAFSAVTRAALRFPDVELSVEAAGFFAEELAAAYWELARIVGG